MKRIGLFGGSFNPIHNGHLHLIQAAQCCLQLDEVILIPAYVSPFKQQRQDVADARDRLEMCRLAAETLPFCRVDSFELDRKQVSYSIYTVEHFYEQYPADRLVLLVGSDMFLSFSAWYDWQNILQKVTLGVVSRETDDWIKLENQKQKLQQYGTIALCKTTALPLSSTKIRENLKNHGDSTCYLPKKVVEYIMSHHLYQG